MTGSMTSQLAHFAIHADDLERARKFGAIFGWKFQGYGGDMTDFCQIDRRPASRQAQGPACPHAGPKSACFDSTINRVISRTASHQARITTHQSLRGFHG